MNTLQIQNPQREFVWVINKADESKPAPAPITKNKNKEKPSTDIQKMIEQSFQKLSSKWLDKINALEKEIASLKEENLALRQTLTK